MSSFLRMMTRPLTSSNADAKLCQIACWIGSAIVLVVGMLNLKKLPLSEAEFFFGVLQVLTVVLLGVLIGLVLPFANDRNAGGLTSIWPLLSSARTGE